MSPFPQYRPYGDSDANYHKGYHHTPHRGSNAQLAKMGAPNHQHLEQTGVGTGSQNSALDTYKQLSPADNAQKNRPSIKRAATFSWTPQSPPMTTLRSGEVVFIEDREPKPKPKPKPKPTSKSKPQLKAKSKVKLNRLDNAIIRFMMYTMT
jgi:hypothetical protein